MRHVCKREQRTIHSQHSIDEKRRNLSHKHDKSQRLPSLFRNHKFCLCVVYSIDWLSISTMTNTSNFAFYFTLCFLIIFNTALRHLSMYAYTVSTESLQCIHDHFRFGSSISLLLSSSFRDDVCIGGGVVDVCDAHIPVSWKLKVVALLSSLKSFGDFCIAHGGENDSEKWSILLSHAYVCRMRNHICK